MSPAFESCPPSLTIGIGVAVFGVELAEMETLEALKVLEVLKVLKALEVLKLLETLDVLEGPEGPIIMPGPIPGVPIKVNGGYETVMGERDKGEEFPPRAAYDLLKSQLSSFWNVL